MEDINNVAVEVKNGEMDEEEIIAYIKYLEKKFPDETLKSLSIKIDGDEVDLDYTDVYKRQVYLLYHQFEHNIHLMIA